MTGTLGGALEARGIPSFPDKLSSNVEGDIEVVDGVMRITKVRIQYQIRLPKGTKETAERALSVHELKCPVAQTLKDCVDIQWSAEIKEEA